MSLDGYIADPKGGFDWIVMDPDIDFNAMFAKFDTLLMGRRTFEVTNSGGGGEMPGVKSIVISRTLKQSDYPKATIWSDGWEQRVRELREKPGKDIWLFGGGELFRAMLEADLVDGLDMGVIPIVLGGGIPFLPPPASRARLSLTGHRVYPKSGIVMLEYDIVRETSAEPTRKASRKKPRKK